jgi:DNA-binding Lrp family transcriptional regulator
MDKTDIFLIQLLLANSRLPYAELAKKLNLSVNAVHKRIQSLVEAGVIRRFTAKVSHFAVNSVHVFIYGNSQIGNIHGLAGKLKTQGSIYWLAVGGGNFLYIGAYLREVHELAALVAYIKEEAEMPEPTVGIMATPPVLPAFNPDDKALYALDY